MNFDLNEEQTMLKDSVSRFVQQQYDFEARNKAIANELGFDADNWSTFAELGWLSVPFAEELGGFGGSIVDTMVVMEELGRGLVAEPYVATVLLFGGLLAASDNPQREALIGQIIEGSLQGAFAYHEKQSRYALNDVMTTAEKQGDGWQLNGEKTVVFNGMAADKLIVSARTSGQQSDDTGISLFLIDADADGVARSSFRMMDGQIVANITLNNVSVASDALIGVEGAALPLMQDAINTAMVARSAEAQGIMEKLLNTTVEYTKTRKQFGVAIGSFQALQHRMVDMFTASEQHRSLLYRAVCAINEGSDSVDKDRHALKVMTGRSGKLIGDEAIQLHGGMGITDELDVGHFVKRLMMINSAFGDADYHQQAFAKLIAA